ncbi:tRNA splicing endonuclease subunit 2 L homeolog isoform X2 [Xenopus laevis]|uniref:tRNA-splicing endonuclease subunit Sen2 n=1 Tax=Xenopus laevis TaxID=8355 RepID=A0A8J0U335_XENLA|nr:tRNA splicing endonuclease subunit 2 L homeolog isoform X2 [Xenopus laevis]
MSKATFHAPKRKRKVYESYESPFPIPLAHDHSSRDFHICQAEILNNHVIVRSTEDIELLYGKGYFGKGILSRSRPQHSIAEQQLQSKWKDIKVNLPIISSRRYKLHLEWAKNLLEEQGLGTESINKILADYTREVDISAEGDVVEENPPAESRMDLDPENGTKSQSSDSNPGKESEGKVFLEGNPEYDPLAKYGPEVLQEERAEEEPDRNKLEKVHCPKHDDFILHCGCKPRRETLQNELDSPARPHMEYLLVEEVQENVDLGPEGTEENKGARGRGRLVCRRNPFRIFEYLQLSREEEPLTIQKLWEVFCAAQPSFSTKYLAYHHFRSKGWVPKVGLKYGTDLLLYRKGPPFYHASYSVIVELVNDKGEGTPLRPLSWRSLAGLHRTTANVSKELLFCYLIKPAGFTDSDFISPACIHRIKVQELIVSRWVSSRERMDHEEL